MGNNYLGKYMPCGIEVEGISFNELALVNRPEHAAVLGRIFTSWSLIESSITALLGLMMHGDHRAALAVLESFNSNNSRVQAVRKIGKEVLDASLREDFDALMTEVLSYARERNAIAHSLWGSHMDKPEFVYRMPMAALSSKMVEAPNNPIVDAEAFTSSLKKDIAALSVADLERTEQKGRDLLLRVMRETTNKAYSRALEIHIGKAAAA
ncbi:hypothetical protein LGN22_32730 [Burkholderia cenocepacia]|uniref:Uncharacterized protein n=1 Tax=Burkholderia cenocepacia TaxID=95486 RepID=A0AAW4TMA1_9BURK|nr:hypothetical protein [Burkholderia cenocepacia]MCA8383686.1 hypothetical protein [Burkholderia cenocepacia]